MSRTTREEELMIEIERLRAWLYKIKNEAFKETRHSVIEWLAEQSLVYSHCVCQPDWSATEDWAKLGVWPPTLTEEPVVAPPENMIDPRAKL